MGLPQLPREPARPDLVDAPLEKEIWRPDWRCFCCQDSGIVNANLVRLIVPDYVHEEDKPVACQKRGCEAGEYYHGDSNYDQRFTSLICTELDKLSRKNWEQTVLTKWEQAKNRRMLDDLAAGKSIRQRDRTLAEEQQTQRRHEDLIAADFKKEKAKKEDDSDDDF